MLELSLTIASLITFIAYLIFSFIIYKKREGEDFKIRNHFPYELWLKRNKSGGLISSISYIERFIEFVSQTLKYLLRIGDNK